MTVANDFGRVAVLMGGSSAEREISLISGKAVLTALRSKGVDAHEFDPSHDALEQLRKFDRAFIVLHGRGGEDGTIQGALQTMGVPYTGSGVMASALCLDKWRTKLVWNACGIPTPAHVLIESDADIASLESRLGLPLIVKPVHEGSTIGITKVAERGQLRDAVELARRYDDMVLAEEFIVGQELTAAVLGTQALPLVRIEAPQGNYDYQNKYFSDETRYFCPSGIDVNVEASIGEQALRAFHVLGCHAWGRADLILRADGKFFFLEMNTVPGMTGHSLVPMAARQVGIDFESLVMRILSMTSDVATTHKREACA
ncbi:MAG: D-alanine--D-alanine ligase [Gammaproteobacteria bacterium]